MPRVGPQEDQKGEGRVGRRPKGGEEGEEDQKSEEGEGRRPKGGGGGGKKTKRGRRGREEDQIGGKKTEWRVGCPVGCLSFSLFLSPLFSFFLSLSPPLPPRFLPGSCFLFSLFSSLLLFLFSFLFSLAFFCRVLGI